MREFSAKTVELCLDKASSELNVEKDKLTYEVVEEKKGFLGINKKATIKVYEFIDVVYYAEEYLKNVCKALGLEISLKSFTKDEIINLFKNFQTNSTVISKLTIDKYNYGFKSNKDEYTLRLTNVDVDTYSTYISKSNIEIDNDLLKRNICIILEDENLSWINYYKEGNDVIISYEIKNEYERYKMTYTLNW